MDLRTTAQDVYLCELCNKEMVEMKCLLCPFKLCKACVGNHIAEDPNKHKIVNYEDRNRTLILPICDIHLQERCKNYCQECEKAVCPTCISSDIHVGHKFPIISQIFYSKKEIIKTDIEELEQTVYPFYEGIVTHVESELAEIKTNYETLEQTIEKQRITWHEEIDTVFNKLKRESMDMRKIQLKALNVQLEKLKVLLAEVHGAIDSNKDLQNSSNVSESLLYISRNQAFKQFPAKLEVSVPLFLSQPINIDSISEIFGVITGFCISKLKDGYKLTTPSANAVFSDKQNETVEIPRKLLRRKPEIESIFDTDVRYPEKLARQNDGKLWVAGNDSTLKLFQKVPLNNGILHFGFFGQYKPVTLKELKKGNGPTDIAVTRTCELIFGHNLENIVHILKQDKTEVLINLYDWKLLSLCITSSDELLVAMTDDRKYRCRVVRYEGSEERQIIQYDEEGKSLYTSGMLRKYVKENQNGDICVADCNAGAVVVTDRAGKFRFRYTGSTSDSSQKKAKFSPMGITTDSQAHILVSDLNIIHIVDMDGQFLRFLDISFSGSSLRLATDKNDNLLVAEEFGTVKMVNYLVPDDIFTRILLLYGMV